MKKKDMLKLINHLNDEDEINKKYIRMGNSMADSILRGLGFAGAAVSVAKNVAIKLLKNLVKKRQNLKKKLHLPMRRALSHSSLIFRSC